MHNKTTKKMLSLFMAIMLLCTISIHATATQKISTFDSPDAKIHYTEKNTSNKKIKNEQNQQYELQQDNSMMDLQIRTANDDIPQQNDIQVLSIYYNEDIYIHHNKQSNMELIIDIPASPLQDMYKEMYGVSNTDEIDVMYSLPESAYVNEPNTALSITTTKNDFFKTITEEHLYSLGVIATPTYAAMIPKTRNNTFQLITKADAQISLLDLNEKTYSLGFGPYALETSTYFFEYQLSIIGYAKLMLQSIPGEQVFKRSWTTTIHFPSSTALINKDTLPQKQWFIDFSDGTYLTAFIENITESSFVLKEVLVVSESDKLLPQPLQGYKTFDITLSMPIFDVKQKPTENIVHKGSSKGLNILTDAIDIFDVTIPYTYEEDYFEATLTVNLYANATFYVSSDESWVLLQAIATATLDVSFTTGYSDEQELFSWDSSSIIHIQAGPVPIQIWLVYGVNIGIEYGVELKTTISSFAGVTASIKIGAKYDWSYSPTPKIQWQKIWEYDFEPFYDVPSLENIQTEFCAWVTPYIEFPVSARLYGVFGPQIKPKIYVTASIGYAFTWDDPNGTLEPYWSIRIGFSIWIGVVVGIPQVYDIEFGFDIIDFTIYEWTNKDPGEYGENTFPPNLDTQAPITSVTLNSPPVLLIDGEYWVGRDFQFSLSAIDQGKVPTGVKKTMFYAGTNENADTTLVYTAGALLNVTTYLSQYKDIYGTFFIKYRSEDNKSQWESTKKLKINVDLFAPNSTLYYQTPVYAYQTPLSIWASDKTSNPSFEGTGYFIMYRIGHESNYTDWIKGPDNEPIRFYLTKNGTNTIEWFATDGVWNSQPIQQQTITNVLHPSYADTYPYYKFSSIEHLDLAVNYSTNPQWQTSCVYIDTPQKSTYRLLLGSVNSYHQDQSHSVTIKIRDTVINEWIPLQTIDINAADSNWYPFIIQLPNSNITSNNIIIYSSLSDALLNVSDGLLYYESTAPFQPTNPTPSDGTFNVAIDNVILQWNAGDADKRDSIYYSISLGNSPNTISFLETIGPYSWDETDISWNYSEYSSTYLLDNTTYYWQIKATDSFNQITIGPLWRFTTKLPPLTVYVDNDFNSNTAGWQNTHFNTIQQGINRVLEQGTVHVFNGTYYETLEIHKTITLQGNNTQNTIIDGYGQQHSLIVVTAENVTISNFTIQYRSIGISIYGNHCTITQNNITYCDTAIHSNSAYNNISNNDITHFTETAVYLSSYSHTNTISKNWMDTIYYNYYEGYGIHCYQSSHNIISSNTITNAKKIGIYLDSYSSFCLVEKNKIFNSEDAIRIQPHAKENMIKSNVVSGSFSGIFIAADNTTLIKNNAVGGWYGVGIWSNHNNILNNTVQGEQYHGVYAGEGTRYNTISNNTATHSNHSGIYLDRIGRNNTVSYNILGSVNTHQQYGIYLYKSHYTTLHNNKAEYLDKDGYYFFDSDFNTFYNNIGYANAGFNVYLNASQRNNLSSNTLFGSNYGGIIMEDICAYNIIENNDINGNLYGCALLLSGESNNNIIQHNSLLSNLYGISLQSSWNNMIYNNTITGNSNPQENFNPTGILLGSCFMNTIANNTFETNHYGIYLSESAGNNPYYYRPNTIVNNLFISNDNSSITTDDYAIYIHKSSISNPITSNIIIATQDSYGIMIDSSSNQTITENTFEHAGISIQSTDKHHWTTHTIINNTANNKPIRYYCNATTITIPQNTSQLILANCNNITINSLNLNQKIDIPIQLAFSSNTHITNNILATDDPNLRNKYAITLLQSPFNTITSNIISNCSIHGILIQQNSNYNEIQKNSITNNGGAGIQLHDSAYNTISNNSAISDNNKGISCISSNSNQILTNYAINNNLYKGIELQQTSNHLIYNNILMSNLIGIDLLDSSNTIISRNSIDNEGDWIGIQLTSSSNNDIKNNSVTQNQVGILLQTHSDNNIINANNITFNNYRGLEIKEPCSIGNIIYYNNFINTPMGQNANDSCSNTYDFSQIGNHWSDYSGSGSYTILPLPTTMDNFPIISPISLECGSLRVPISADLIGYPRPGWTTGGNSEWFIQSSYVLEGEVALQSGPIDHNQHSLVSTIVDGPGTLSFFWSVHSEPFGDTLSVFIDNQKIEQISGEVFWMPMMLDIPHGYHEITWVYSKNEHDSFGMDCGWIDAITWEGIMTIPSIPTPYDGEQQIEKYPQLSFIAGDPDPGDMVTYELYLSTNPNPELLTTLGPYPWDQTYITYSPGELMYGLTYYWKVISWDNHGNTVESPLWKFTVKEKFSHGGLWHFNEGMGQTAYDETPYQNHGVLHGPTWAEGYHCSGLYFDGNDDVTIVHSPSLDIQGPFCVSAWIQAQGNDNYNCIVDKYYHAGAYGYGFSVYLTAGKLRFTIYSGQHGIKDIIGTTDLRNKGWHHIKAEWDGTTMSVSVNGIQEKAVEWTHPPASNTANLGIGKRLSGWGGFLYFKGYIDEVHITVNDAPYIASNPYPLHGQSEVSPSTILSWTGGDPNYEDTVYYDIYLEGEDQTPDERIAFNLEDTTFDVTDILLNNTVYYWYVVSKDNHGLRSTSPVWMFETIQGYSNTPPNVPSSPFPENLAVNQPNNINLSWIAQDPNGDLVTFDIYLEANDPTPDDIIAQGHTLSYLNVENLEQETTYYWQIVAYDTYGESTYGPVWSFTTEQNPFMTMTRVLSQGWNYVSFNVIPEDVSMSSIMQPLIDQGVYLIVHDGGTGIFWPAYSIDTIGQMHTTKGYRIYVNQQATLLVTGLRISLSKTIYLWQGWNLIGCPFDQPRDALEVLQPLIDDDVLIYVKSQDEKAIYYEDSTWVNEIGDFIPGYGYYVKVSSDTSLVIPAF